MVSAPPHRDDWEDDGVVWALDDEPDMVDTLASVLSQSAYRFRGFTDPKEMLRALEHEVPQLLILDLMMPSMPGNDVLRRIRCRAETAELPVLVLTALSSESSILNAFEAGADDVVQKPFSVPELLARISWQVRRRRQMRELRQRSRDMELMAGLARSLSSEDELASALSSTADAVEEGLSVRECSIFLVDPASGDLVEATERIDDEPAEPRTLDLSRLEAAAARVAGGEIVTLDAERDPRLQDALSTRAPEAFRAAAIVPLRLQSELVGVMMLVSGHPEVGVSSRHRRVLSLASDLASVAIHRVSLYESIRAESQKIDETNRTLEQTRDFLNNVIESSPDAIVAALRDGKIVLFNRAAESILGWSKADALGMGVENLYPGDGAQNVMTMLRSPDYGGEGRLDTRREVVVDCEGREIPVEISAAVVYEDGREAATVGIFTDLRPRLKMQERLDEATQSLERTRQKALLAELAGAAAHELNQPLTSLLGYAELLVERMPDQAEGPEARAARIILRETKKVADIVKKIGKITNYRTKEYVAGAKIVDLDQSVFDGENQLDPEVLLDELSHDESSDADPEQ
ncbi:MAG: response regulator [Myxococcota bacterium]